MVTMLEAKHLFDCLNLTHGEQPQCTHCGRWYTELDVILALEDLFGTDTDEWDEDYIVLVAGLCPNCWCEPL